MYVVCNICIWIHFLFGSHIIWLIFFLNLIKYTVYVITESCFQGFSFLFFFFRGFFPTDDFTLGMYVCTFTASNSEHLQRLFCTHFDFDKKAANTCCKGVEKRREIISWGFPVFTCFFFFGKLIRFSKQKENIHKFNKNTI